jgi:hypothetical protein
MNYDEVKETVIDRVADIINDIYAEWCENNSIETDADDAYERFSESEENQAINDAMSEMLSDRS